MMTYTESQAAKLSRLGTGVMIQLVRHKFRRCPMGNGS